MDDANQEVNPPGARLRADEQHGAFASDSFGAMTWLVVRLCGTSDGGRPRRGWPLSWRIGLAGVLAPTAMSLFGIPSSIFGGDTPNVTAQAWVLGIELGLIWLAGLWILVSHLRSGEGAEPMTPFADLPGRTSRGDGCALARRSSRVPRRERRLTTDGTPIGSVLYTIACFIGAFGVLAVLFTGRRRANVPVG